MILWVYRFLYIAVEMLAVWLYCDQIFKSKRHQWVTPISFYAVYSLLGFLYMEEAVPIVWLCAGYFVGNCALLLFNYRCDLMTCVFQGGYTTYLMITARVLVALAVLFVRADNPLLAALIVKSDQIFLVCGVVFCILSQISVRCFKLTKNTQQTGSFMAVLVVLPLVSAWVAMETVYRQLGKKVISLDMLQTVSVLLLLLLGFVVLLVYIHVQKVIEERLALELQIQKERANADYYNMLNEQYTNQRILVHDTSRHLQSIKNLLSENDSPALMEYVQEMEKEVHSQQMVRLCDNAVLNAILFRHAEFCRQNGIEYSFDIREHAVDAMNAVDITALFDNLLSNAVESAARAEKRFVELSAVKDDVSLLVTLVNTCDAPPETDEAGGLVTKKDDKASHGIGTKSIARVVKKYSGVSDFYYIAAERQFHMVIHIPLL